MLWRSSFFALTMFGCLVFSAYLEGTLTVESLAIKAVLASLGGVLYWALTTTIDCKNGSE